MADAGAPRGDLLPGSKAVGHDAPSTSFASSLLSGPFGVGDIGARRLAPSENAADCVARLHSAIKDKDLPSMGELLLELADCYISTVASSPESMVSAARVVHEAAKLELVTQGKQSKGALKKGKKGAAGVGPTASVASVLLPSLGGAPAGAEKPAKQAEASRLGGADGPASGVAPSNNQHEEAKETVGPAEGSSTREPTEQAGKDEPPAEKTGSEMEARESVMKERKIVPKKRIRRFTSVGEEGSRTKLAGNKRLSSEMDEDELPSRDASLATFEIGSTSGGKDTSGGSSSRADEASSELGPTLKTTPASSHGASSSGARLPGSSQGGAARDDWQNLSQTLMPLANGKVASNDPLWGLASSLVAQEHTIPMTARAIFKAFSGLVMAICHTPEGKSNKNLSAEVYAALTETAVEVLHILKGQKLLAFALRFLGAIFPPKSNSSSGVGALGGAANKGAKAAAKVAAPAPKVATPMKVAGTPPATATTPAKSSPAVIASGVPADYVHSMSITAPLKALMGGAALPSPLQNLASGSPSSMALKARGIRAVAAVAFAATAPVVAEKAVKAIVNSLNSQQPELVSTGEALGAITTHLSSASLKTVCEDAVNFTVYSMGRFPEASTIQVSGCIALASLTKTVSSTVLFSAWSAATAAMQHHPEDLRVQRAGCTALHNISSLVSLATPEWVSPKRPLWATRDNDREEAAQWLLAAMARFPDDIRVQWQGCHVLTTLLQSAGLRTVLYVAGRGGMGAIARAMRMCKKNEALIQQCCSALAALVQAAQEAGGDVIRREGGAQGGIPSPADALGLGAFSGMVPAAGPASSLAKPVAAREGTAHTAVNTQGSYGLDLLRAVAGDLVDLPAVLGADVAGLQGLGAREGAKSGGGDAFLSTDSSKEFLKSNRGRTGQRKHNGSAQNEAPTGEEWSEALRAVVGAMKQFPKLKLVQSNSCLLLGTAARMIPNDLAQILPAQVPFEEGLGLPAVDEKHLLIDQAIDAVVAAMDNHREDEIVQPWGAAFLAQAFLLYTTPSRAGQIIAQEHSRRVQSTNFDAQPSAAHPDMASSSSQANPANPALLNPDPATGAAAARTAKGKAPLETSPQSRDSSGAANAKLGDVPYYGQDIDALPGAFMAAAIRANLKKACKALLKLAGLLESNTDTASNSLRRGWCEAMEIMVCTFGRLSLDVERGLVAAKWTQFSLENHQTQGQLRGPTDGAQPLSEQNPQLPPFSFPDPAALGLGNGAGNPLSLPAGQNPFPAAVGFPSSYSVSHIEVTTYIAALSNAAAMSAGGSQLLPAFLGNGLGFNLEPQALAAALGGGPALNPLSNPPTNPPANLPAPTASIESNPGPSKASSSSYTLAGGSSRPATTLHAAANIPPALTNFGTPASAPWQQGASFTNFGLTHYSQSGEEEDTWKALARFCRDYAVEEWRLAAHLTGQTAKPLGFKAHLLNVLSIATKSLTVQDDADVMHSLCLLITEIFLVWEHLHSGGNIVALHAAAKASLEKSSASGGPSSSHDDASEVLRANGLATPKPQPGSSLEGSFELRSATRNAGSSGNDVSTSGSAAEERSKPEGSSEGISGGKETGPGDGVRAQTNAAASTSGMPEIAESSTSRKAVRQKGAESSKQPSLGARGPKLGTRNTSSSAPSTSGKPPPGVKKPHPAGLELPIPVSLQERGSQPGVFTTDAGVGDMIEAVLYLTAMDGHFEALAAALEALHNCLLVAARPQEVDEFFGINSDGCKATDILAALKKAIAKPPIKITAETSPDVIREQDGRRRVAFEALLVLKAVCDKNVAAQLEVAVFEGIDLVFDAFDKYRDDEEMKDAAMKVLGLEEELWRKSACVQALWAALKANRQKYLAERSKGLAKKKKKAGGKADPKQGSKRPGGKRDIGDEDTEEKVRGVATAGISATRWQEIAEIVAGELHDDFPRRWGGLRTIDDLLSKEDFYSMLGLFLEDRKLAVEELIGKDLDTGKGAEPAVKYLQWIIQGHPDCGTVHLGLLRTAILYDEDEYLPGSGPNAAVKLLQYLNEKQANWSDEQPVSPASPQPHEAGGSHEPATAKASKAQNPSKASTSAAPPPAQPLVPQWQFPSLPTHPYMAGFSAPPSGAKAFPTPADILSSWASLFTGASSPFRHAPSWSPLSASNQKAVGPAATVFAQAQLCELLGHLSCDWEDELIEGGCIGAVLDAMEAVWFWRDVKSMATLLPHDERLAHRMRDLQNPPTIVLVRDHKGETALVVVPAAHTGLVWKGEWDGDHEPPSDAHHFFIESPTSSSSQPPGTSASISEAGSSNADSASTSGVDKVRGGRAPMRDPGNPLSRAGGLIPREWRETLDSYLQRKALFALYSLCKEMPGKEAALQAQANHAATVAMCRYHPYEWNMGVRCGFNREVIKAAHLVLARLHIERIWDKNVTYWLAHECAKGNDHAALEAMVAEGLPGLWAEDGAGHVPLHYARELQRAACVAILEDLQRKRRAKKKGKKAKKKSAAEQGEAAGGAAALESPDTPSAVPISSDAPSPKTHLSEPPPPAPKASTSVASSAPGTPNPSANAALRSVVDASSLEGMRAAVEAYAALADGDAALVETLKGIVEDAERTVVRSASAMVAGVKGRLDVLADSGSKRAIKNTHTLLEKIGQASTLSEFQAAVERYSQSSAADPVLCTVLADVLRESEKKMRESMAQAERKVGESQGKSLALATKGKGGALAAGDGKGASKEERGAGKEEKGAEKEGKGAGKVEKNAGKEEGGKKAVDGEAREKRDAKQKGKEKKGKESKVTAKEKGSKAGAPSAGEKGKPKAVEEEPSVAEISFPESSATASQAAKEVQAAISEPAVEEPVVASNLETPPEVLELLAGEEELANAPDEDAFGGEEEEWVNVMSRRKLRESLKGSAPAMDTERPLSGRQRRAKEKEAAARVVRESPERASHQSPPREERALVIDLLAVQAAESTPSVTPKPKETAGGSAWKLGEVSESARVGASFVEEDEREGGVGPERTAWGPNAQPGGHLAKRTWAEQVEEEDRAGGQPEASAHGVTLDKRKLAEADSKRGKGKSRGGKQRGKTGRGPGTPSSSAAILPSPLPPLLPTPSESLHIAAEPAKRRPNAGVPEWPSVNAPSAKPSQKQVLPGTGVFHAADEEAKQAQAEVVRKRGGPVAVPSDPPLASLPVRPPGVAWGRPPAPGLANGPQSYDPLTAPITPLQQWAPPAYPDLPASLDMDFLSSEGGAHVGQTLPPWMDPSEPASSLHHSQNSAPPRVVEYPTPGSSSFFQSAAQDAVVTPFPRLPSPQASVSSSADWNGEPRPSSSGLGPLRTSRPSSSAGLFSETGGSRSPPLSPPGHVLQSILSDLLPDATLGSEDESGAESQPFDLNGEGITDTPAGVHLPAGLLASDDPVSSSPHHLTFGSLPADLGDLGAESVHPLPPQKGDPGHPLGGFWPDYRPSPEEQSPRIPSSPGLPAHLQNPPYMHSPYGYPGQGHLGYNSPMPNMYSGHPIFDSYPGAPHLGMTPGDGDMSHSLFSSAQRGGHLTHQSPYAPQQQPERPGSGSALGQEQHPARMLFMEEPCSICLERQKNCALLPCGHQACALCSQQMHMRRMLCPMCNRAVEGVLQLFS